MNRFTRQSRLLQPAEFRAVFNGNPSTVSDRHFRLLAISRPTPGNGDSELEQSSTGSRLGLAIAKKNVRKASQRNCIKRQAREVFRNFPALQQAKLCNVVDACGEQTEEMVGSVQLDIVVLAKAAAASADKACLRQSLEQLLRQLTQTS
jgi:ribonuclease P protein component